MKIWVDADACPRPIKEILYRAAKREQLLVTFVANLPLKVPVSPFLKTLLVPGGFDIADDRIVELTEDNDLVVTADIPLAAKIVEKGAFAINPRGYFYSQDNIGEVLTMRNMMDEMRSTGIETGGPQAFSMQDRENFANRFDRFIKTGK